MLKRVTRKLLHKSAVKACHVTVPEDGIWMSQGTKAIKKGLLSFLTSWKARCLWMDEGRAGPMDVAVENGCRLDGRGFHALILSMEALPAGI